MTITSPLTFAAYGISFRLSEHRSVDWEAHRPRNRLLATNNGMPQKSSIPPALHRADDDLTTNAAQRRQRAWEKAFQAFFAADKLVQSDKKSRLDAVSVWMPEFSASKGQRFAPRRQRAVLFGHCSFLFDHKNSNAGRGHNGRGARCKKHKITFSCANANWPVSVQGDIQSPGPGALPEV